MNEIPTRYGPAERFDRWIEQHIWAVLGSSLLVAGALMVIDSILY